MIKTLQAQLGPRLHRGKKMSQNQRESCQENTPCLDKAAVNRKENKKSENVHVAMRTWSGENYESSLENTINSKLI